MASAGTREGGSAGPIATASSTPASGLRSAPRQCVAGVTPRRLPGSPLIDSRALPGHCSRSPRSEKCGPVSPRAEERVAPCRGAPCRGAPLPAQVPTPDMARIGRASQVQQEREQRPSGVQRQVSTPIPQRTVWPAEPVGRASEGHACAYNPSEGSAAAPALQVARRTTGPRVFVVPPSAKFEPPAPTTDHFTPSGKAVLPSAKFEPPTPSTDHFTPSGMAKPEPLEQALTGKDSGSVPPKRSAVEVAEELVAGAAATARAAAEVAAADGWRPQQQQQPHQQPQDDGTASQSSSKQAAQLVTLADLHMAAKRAGELHSQGLRDRRNLGGA